MLVAGLLAASCGRQSPPNAPTLTLRAASYAELPGWVADDSAASLAAFRDTCTRLAAMPAKASLGGAGEAAALGGTAGQWRPACAAATTVAPGGARGFFERWLQPYAVGDASTGDATGLFTGYYEPEVRGSRSRDATHAAPLYARPADLVQVDLGAFLPELKGRSISGRVAGGALVPYWDRAEIEAGALAGRHLELFWLADAYDGFVLEIQGSGRVRLPDGSVVRVSYDGQNGRPYVPIGRVLLQRGDLARGSVTMQSIRAWIQAHPAQAPAVLDANPSTVFFRDLGAIPPGQGPPGALGAPLTPGRSVAVDRHFLPLGAPVFVATTDPLDGTPLQRLMQAQDVGGAIRGPVRADIFFGWGAPAEARAGAMQARGRDWVLLPRAPPVR